MLAHNYLEVLVKTLSSKQRVFDAVGLIFFILGVYLVSKEFLLFFVDRPTHSTIQDVKMDPAFIPLIRLCPQSGLDLERLTSAGYSTVYSFFSGFQTEDESKFVGWSGNTNKHPLDFLDDVSAIHNISDIILSTNFHGYHKSISAEVELTQVIYPYGQCVTIKPPEEEGIKNLEIVFNPDGIKNSKVHNIKVFLQDRNLDVKYLTSGHTLAEKAFIENHDTIYNLEIKINKELEEHQRSNCRPNSKEYDFVTCFESQMNERFEDLVGCIPPWFTSNREKVCNKSMKSSENAKLEMSKIFFDLYANSLSTNCPDLCTNFRYIPRFLRLEHSRTKSRLYVNFPKIVREHKIQLNVNLMSFFVR